MPHIDKVSERTKLKPRREPYWAKVSKGAYLGFRKMAANSEGTWVARCLDEVTGKQQYRALGDLSPLPSHQRRLFSIDVPVGLPSEWPIRAAPRPFG